MGRSTLASAEFDSLQMASSSRIHARAVQRSVCDSLSSEDAELVAWVRSTLELFPLPGPMLAPPLFDALRRIAIAVPWLEGALGYSVVVRVQQVVDGLGAAGTISRPAAQAQLVGDYALAGAMVGSESIPMPGAEQLRATLWLCGEVWRKRGDLRARTVADVASAIRNAVKSRTKQRTDAHPLARHLREFGMAKSLQDFVQISAVLRNSEQDSIRAAWAHVWPLLVELTQSKSSAHAPAPTPADKPRPRPKKALNQDFEEEEEKFEAWVDQVRVVKVPPVSDPDSVEQDEPTTEDSVVVVVTPVEPSVANPVARRMARHRARQVVWSQNSFLLTNHPDVLPLSTYRRVLDALLDPPLEGDENLRSGMAGLLIQAVTGRTSRSLLAMRAVDRFDVDPKAPCELSLSESALRVRVYFADDTNEPTGYFMPVGEQVDHLEPVGEWFSLPLPSAVVETLRRLDSFGAGTDLDRAESSLREAARHVSSILGTSISVGQVRRSFAAHLYELCRDMALTQLICADSLGQSDAPGHYYAPRSSDVARTYESLMRQLISVDERESVVRDSESRVGSRLLVQHDFVREMTRSLGAIFHAGVDRLVDEGQVVRLHHAMVAQLGCMLLAACGHRPTESLFQLDLGNVDIEGQCALFADKVHDPAHDPRLVALPTCVVAQIRAYMEHLMGMAELAPQLRSTVKKIKSGRAPLLFGLDADGQHHPLNLKMFASQLPAVWRILPLNWGRTWIRTRCVESGLSPELASIQLGHLEAVGYPFSNASPTEPLQFIRAIVPALDRQAAIQGWKVQRGLRSTGDGDPTLEPLSPWATKVNEHESAARELARKWRERQMARRAHYRIQAERDVLANPEITRRGIDAMYADRVGPWKPHGLARTEAEALRDQLFESADGDLALGLARADALCRILKCVNRRTGNEDQTPTSLMLLRRPVNNAFIPGMMMPVRQVRALRRAALDRTTQATGDWRDFSAACARVAYVLAVFGFCEFPDQIVGVLEHRTTAVRPASLNDTIVVQWGTGPQQVLGLRGLAAMAVARLAKKYPNQVLPEPDDLNLALSRLLPSWAVGAPGNSQGSQGLLQLLCETVSVSNRLELSPAARMALDPCKGSVSACLSEQLALLDHDPAGTVRRDSGEPPVTLHDDDMPRGVRRGNARSQYLALCRSIPSPGVNLHLPLTGCDIDASRLNVPSTRLLVIAELKAQLAEHSPEKVLQPVVRLLSRWVLQMLEEGTAQKRNPADRTISTYLTRIGGGLVEILGNSSLHALGDAELEDAYLDVIRQSRVAQDQAAAAIMSFHDCCVRHFGLPELDLAEVREHLGTDIRSVDAALILPAERDAALGHIMSRCDSMLPKSESDRSAARVMRQAAVALPMYAHTGARRSEVLGVKYRDIAWDGGNAICFRIRPNRSRRLKTFAARRVLAIDHVVPPHLASAMSDWLLADQSRLPAWRNEQAYVFSPLHEGRRIDGREAVANVCAETVAAVTGRKREHLHRLRHLVAFERTTPLFLTTADCDVVFGEESPQLRTPSSGIVLPRDMAGAVVSLGHAHWSTTLRSYHHIPWLLRSRSDNAISKEYLNRRGVAAAMGLSLPAVDRVVQAAKHLDPPTAWMDHVIKPRVRPESTTEHPIATSAEHRAWTAKELNHLVHTVERVGSLQKALVIVGATQGEADEIRTQFLLYEKRLGRRILSGEWVASLGMPKRVVRDTRKLAIGDRWLECHGNGLGTEETSRLDALCAEIYECMSPDHGDAIVLSRKSSDYLHAQLQEAGIPSASIHTKELPLGLLEMRIVRHPQNVSESEKPVKRYLGLTIKRVVGLICVACRLSS